TERGLWTSFDAGKRWIRMPAPFPTVPVNDIQIHPRENDLIVGTHGRSVWILDDITPLEKMAGSALSYDVTLCEPRPAIAWRLANLKGDTGHKIFIAPNPPNGALIQFLLRGKATAGEVKLTILNASGKTVIRELSTVGVKAGWNRVVWDLRQSLASP